MKKLTMTTGELNSISRNELEQFALVIRDLSVIDANNGVELYNKYMEANEANDEVGFQDVLDWYIEMKDTKEFVILRVFNGDIYHVDIERA